MSRSSLKAVAEAALALLKEGVAPERLGQTLAAYLVAERRTGELEVLARIMTELRAKQGTHEALVSSAFPVNDSLRVAIDELIRSRQTGVKTVVINERQDRSAIGGLRVETNELLLDATISNKLKHLYQLTSTT